MSGSGNSCLRKGVNCRVATKSLWIEWLRRGCERSPLLQQIFVSWSKDCQMQQMLSLDIAQNPQVRVFRFGDLQRFDRFSCQFPISQGQVRSCQQSQTIRRVF